MSGARSCCLLDVPLDVLQSNQAFLESPGLHIACKYLRAIVNAAVTDLQLTHPTAPLPTQALFETFSALKGLRFEGSWFEEDALSWLAEEVTGTCKLFFSMGDHIISSRPDREVCEHAAAMFHTRAVATALRVQVRLQPRACSRLCCSWAKRLLAHPTPKWWLPYTTIARSGPASHASGA